MAQPTTSSSSTGSAANAGARGAVQGTAASPGQVTPPPPAADQEAAAAAAAPAAAAAARPATPLAAEGAAPLPARRHPVAAATGAREFLAPLCTSRCRWLLSLALAITLLVPAALYALSRSSWLGEKPQLLLFGAKPPCRLCTCTPELVARWRGGEYAYSLAVRASFRANARASALLANDTQRADAFLYPSPTPVGTAGWPAAAAADAVAAGGNATARALDDAAAAAKRLSALNASRTSFPAECTEEAAAREVAAASARSAAGGGIEGSPRGGAAAAGDDGSGHAEPLPPPFLQTQHPFAVIPPPPSLYNVSFLLQFFHRPDVVPELVSRLAACGHLFSSELLVNLDDDSHESAAAWRTAREARPTFVRAIIQSPNIHEVCRPSLAGGGTANDAH